MRYCHHRQCGSPVPPVARFCPRCGLRLKRSRGRKWLIIPLAIGAGFIFLGLGVAPRAAVPAAATSNIEVSETPLRQSRPNGTPFAHTPMHP